MGAVNGFYANTIAKRTSPWQHGYHHGNTNINIATWTSTLQRGHSMATRTSPWQQSHAMCRIHASNRTHQILCIKAYSHCAFAISITLTLLWVHRISDVLFTVRSVPMKASVVCTKLNTDANTQCERA